MIDLLFLALVSAAAPNHLAEDIPWPTWECEYQNPPKDFPQHIQFVMVKDGRGGYEILERGHAAYRIQQDNSLAIVAVSSNADAEGRFVGPAAHTIEQQFIGNGVRWHDVLIWAETLEINRTTGASVIAAVRLDGSPILPVHGKCRQTH